MAKSALYKQNNNNIKINKNKMTFISFNLVIFYIFFVKRL